MTIYSFTPEFFFYTSIPNHSEMKEKYLPRLQKDLDKRGFQGYTSSAKTTFGLSYNKELFDQDFVDTVIWKSFHQMMDELPPMYHKSKINYIEIQDVWYNYYAEGHICRPHRHLKSSFSAIYLLHLEEENTTTFLPTLDIANHAYIMYDNYAHTKFCKEGDVLIFPSSLMHYAETSMKDRWVIVWNFGIPKCTHNMNYSLDCHYL